MKVHRNSGTEQAEFRSSCPFKNGTIIRNFRFRFQSVVPRYAGSGGWYWEALLQNANYNKIATRNSNVDRYLRHLHADLRYQNIPVTRNIL